MASTTIKTRIRLRNDMLSNWLTSSLLLDKGELAIAMNDGALAEVRVGTGSSTWANAKKLAIDVSQISGLVDAIQGSAKKYQVVANGEGGNSWKLQESPLSTTAWTDVEGSTWTIDFTSIQQSISEISSVLSSVSSTAVTISSDYLKASDFASLSAEIGLDVASASNRVATLSDIAGIAGAMHFRGAVTPTSGQTDAAAIAAGITDPANGDVVIVTTTSKEYVYSNGSWIELGDEELYATKASIYTREEVQAISADTYGAAKDYVDGILSDFLILDCGTAALRSGEPTASNA